MTKATTSCDCGDQFCPGNDGDACNYKAVGDSPAWRPPVSRKMFRELEQGDRIRLGGEVVEVADSWRYGEDEERISVIPVDGPERFGFWSDDTIEVLHAGS